MKITEAIKAIKKISANPDNADAHDPLIVAGTYAGQCEVVNSRLKKCLSLIKKNQVQQAIEEAAYEPHLIDLCNEMNNSILTEWRELCKQKSWPIPEELNIDAFNEIMKSFSMESAIEPLIKKLRRANNQGYIGQCAAILRELVSRDPSNPEWKSDLEEFETAYLEKIKHDIEKFKQQKNINSIARLIVELKEKWSISVDSVKVQDLENFIEEQYKENLKKEEEDIVGRIGAAFQSGNVESLGNAILEYNNLEKKKYFKPDPSLTIIYSNALNWYEQQLKSIEFQKNYESRIAEAQERIAKNYYKGIQSLWEEIKLFRLPIPEKLESDVKRLILKEEKAKKRRQKTKQMGYLLIIIFAMACVYLASVWNYYREIKSRLISDLDSAAASEKLEESNTIIDDMAKRQIRFVNFSLFSKSEMSRERLKVTKLLELLEHKKASFQILIVELESLRSQGFPKSVQEIEKKIIQIKETSNVLTPINTARLKLIESAWEDRKKEIRAAEEKELASIFEKIDGQFQNFLSAATESEIDINQNILKNIEELIQQGGQLVNVSNVMKQNLKKFKDKMNSTKDVLFARQSQLKEIVESNSLDEYIKSLQTFQGAFPDDELTKKINSIIALSGFYNDFISLPSLESYNESSSKNDDSRQSVVKSESVFWSQTKEMLRAFNNNVKIHSSEVEEELRKMERTPRFADLWECTVNRPNFNPEKWYFSGKPSEEFIEGIKSYTGIAYILSSDDLQPEFKENHAITVHVQDLKKMRHCDVVQQMLNNIFYDISMETIMHEIKNIYKQPFSPILKFHIINFLTDKIFLLVGKENSLPFTDMANDFKRFNNRVNWLCTTNSMYHSESRIAQTILNYHLERPDKMNAEIIKWKVRKITMKRVPVWVGFADFRNPEVLHFKTGKKPNEVWVARNIEKNSINSPVVFMTEIQKMGERVKNLDHKNYLPGEPLFAPYDDNTTEEIVQSILDNINSGRPVDIDWPVTWPINARGRQ